MAVNKYLPMGYPPAARITAIDQIFPTNNFDGTAAIGVYFIAGSKSALRRTLSVWDVFGVPAVGTQFVGGELINDAYLEGIVLSRFGTIVYPGWIIRIKRDDWLSSQATWERYITTNVWSALGANGSGDIDGVTPAMVAFSIPGGPGPFTWTGLQPHVQDAIDNRFGLVNLRFHLDDERGFADNPNDRMITIQGATFYLCVDYTPAIVDAERPPQALTGDRFGQRPEFDHIQIARPGETGELLRSLVEARELSDQVLRAR